MSYTSTGRPVDLAGRARATPARGGNMGKLPLIEVGFQLYAVDGDDPFGAVRDVVPSGRAELTVNIEGAGDFSIPLDAVRAVHSQKVIVDVERLDGEVRRAIAEAHAREDYPPARGPR
jgi:hypothetical protein